MMLADAFLDVIRKEYPLFRLEIREGDTEYFCEVSKMREIAEEMIGVFLGCSYHYELPSNREDYNAHIGKKTKETILVYKKITNIYGLPTYNKARIVFKLPANLPEEKVYRFLWKVDKTFDNLYHIKKLLDRFMGQLLPSGWEWGEDLKEMVDAIVKRRFNKASILFEEVAQKRSIRIPGGFVTLPSCIFKTPQMSLDTGRTFVVGLLIQVIDNLKDYQKSKALIDFFLFREEKHF